MRPDIFYVAQDYFTTRPLKKHICNFLIAGLPAFAVWMILKYVPIDEAIKIKDVFNDFVNVQISAIAILISFSIAIVTIMITADNENIRSIKNAKVTQYTKKNKKGYKPFRNTGSPLSLFQVLLSNITYNVLVEVIYLIALIFCVFLQIFIPENLVFVFISVCVFFIMHIFHILLESVSQMYFTFWKN